MNPSVSFAFRAALPVILATSLLASCSDDKGSAPRSYTITFETFGGPTVAPLTVDAGKTATGPAAPTGAGYIFRGWYTDEALTIPFDFSAKPITANLKLYAQWTLIITFADGLALFRKPYASIVFVKRGQRANVSSFDFDANNFYNFIFKGFYTDAGLTQAFDFDTPITAPLTLYSGLINADGKKVYTVRFSTSTSITVNFIVDGESATSVFFVPQREGYTFGGWYADSELTQAFDFNTAVTASLTLYAKWTFKVTFETFGGPVESPLFVEKGKVAARPADPLWEDYTFGGWYANPGLTQDFDFSAPIKANITLYARWTPNSSNARAAAQLLLFSFEEQDYNFSTWYDERSVKGLIDQSTSAIAVEPSAYLQGWNIKTLKATFAVSPGATVRVGGTQQISGATANDFSQQVVYEVTAANGITQQTYTITVSPQSKLADIPDDIFRNYLQGSFGSAFLGDRLDVAKAVDATGNITLIAMVSNNTRTYSPIQSLKGIEFFSGITSINLGDPIEQADINLSRNAALESAFFDHNQLQHIDLSENIALTRLGCTDNWRLQSLDIRGIRSVGAAISGDTYFADSGLIFSDLPSLVELRVHDNLKDHEAIKALKTARGESLKVSTYSAAAGSIAYTETCANYDPNGNSGKGACLEQS